MKKNIENQVENVNAVENNVTEEQAKQFVADNLHRVSKVMRSRFDALPYFILARHILYDGKEICTLDLDDFCPEEKMYSESS